MTSQGHFHSRWGSLSRTDEHLRHDPVSSLSEHCGLYAKEGNPVFGVSSLLSFHTPIFSHHLLCFLLFPVMGKLSLPALFFCFSSPPSLSLHHLYLSSIPAAYSIYPFPPPLSALHAFTPLSLYTTPLSLPIPPLYPHKNGYRSGGKFIRSKNKHVSVSVLLPCRVPQGCTALWMALSVRLVWGSAHTFATHTTACTRFPKDTQKQLSLLFSSFVIAVIPLKPIWP